MLCKLRLMLQSWALSCWPVNGQVKSLGMRRTLLPSQLCPSSFRSREGPCSLLSCPQGKKGPLQGVFYLQPLPASPHNSSPQLQGSLGTHLCQQNGTGLLPSLQVCQLRASSPTHRRLSLSCTLCSAN